MLASRWSVLDTWIRLILAVVAAVSAITLLQEQPQLALAFALTTALLSAVNPALDPASRSKEHRAVSYGLRHVERNAGQLLGLVHSKLDTRLDGPPGHESYTRGTLTDTDLAAYGKRLVDLETDADELLDKAPPLNRLRSSEFRYPRTEAGFSRLKRRQELRRRVDALYSPRRRRPPTRVQDSRKRSLVEPVETWPRAVQARSTTDRGVTSPAESADAADRGPGRSGWPGSG